MASRPPPPPLSGDPFPPLPRPLSYRAALVAPLAGISPVAVLSPAAGAPPGLTAPAAALSLAAGAPPDLAAPAAALSPAIGAPPAAPLLRRPSLPWLEPRWTRPRPWRPFPLRPARPWPSPRPLWPPSPLSPALHIPSLLPARHWGTSLCSPPRFPPLLSHLRPRRLNLPPSRQPLATTGPRRLLRSPYRMSPSFALSCWRRVFHMSPRLAGPPFVAAPCRPLSIVSRPPSSPPCALLRTMLLPFSPPPGRPLRLLASGPRTPPVLLSRSRRLSTPLSASTAIPTAVSLAKACRMPPPHPLATAPTPSSPRLPRPQPFAPLFMLRRRPSPASGQPSPTSLRRPPLSTPGGAIRSCRPFVGTPSPTTSSQRSLTRQRIDFRWTRWCSPGFMAPSRPNFRTSFAYRTPLLTGSKVLLRLSSSATARLGLCTSRPPSVSLLRASLCGRVLPSNEDDGGHSSHPQGPHHRRVPHAQPLPRLEPSLRSCDAHPHPHEAFSHLCRDQGRSTSRGASPFRRSRHGALQRSSGSPLCLWGDPLRRTPASRRLELFGSLLAPRGSQSRSRSWSQEWTR
jgi:hypothetical protein